MSLMLVVVNVVSCWFENLFCVGSQVHSPILM